MTQKIKIFEKMFDDENAPNKQKKKGSIEITEYKQK